MKRFIDLPVTVHQPRLTQNSVIHPKQLCFPVLCHDIEYVEGC